MGSVIGALACSTASPGVTLVRGTEPIYEPLIYADQLDTFLTVGCWSLWCPCVVYSYNRQRLLSLQNQGTPLPRGSESLDTSCCLYFGLVLFGFGWVLQVR